jgi:hypothetical protein
VLEDALRKEIFRIAFMVVYLLSKERNKGCIVLLAIGYQPKMKSFGASSIIRSWVEIQQSKTYDCCQSLQTFHLGSDAKY